MNQIDIQDYFFSIFSSCSYNFPVQLLRCAFNWICWWTHLNYTKHGKHKSFLSFLSLMKSLRLFPSPTWSLLKNCCRDKLVRQIYLQSNKSERVWTNKVEDQTNSRVKFFFFFLFSWNFNNQIDAKTVLFSNNRSWVIEIIDFVDWVTNMFTFSSFLIMKLTLMETKHVHVPIHELKMHESRMLWI